MNNGFDKCRIVYRRSMCLEGYVGEARRVDDGTWVSLTGLSLFKWIARRRLKRRIKKIGRPVWRVVDEWGIPQTQQGETR